MKHQFLRPIWYSTFLGLRPSEGLMNEAFNTQWVNSDFYGSMDDDFAMFAAGGEPYPRLSLEELFPERQR